MLFFKLNCLNIWINIHVSLFCHNITDLHLHHSKHQAPKLSLFFREVFITGEWKQQRNWESAFVLLFMLCGRWIRAGERSTDACYQPWQSYRDLQCSINLVNWIPNPDCWALGKKQTMLRELFCNAGLPVGTSMKKAFHWKLTFGMSLDAILEEKAPPGRENKKKKFQLDC